MKTQTKEKWAVFLPAKKDPQIVNLASQEHGSELETLQFAVQGWVQAVSLAQDWEGLVLWVNEEHKLVEGMSYNYLASEVWLESFRGYLLGANDFILGNAVITGEADENGETLSLSIEQAERIIGLLNAKMKNAY